MMNIRTIKSPLVRLALRRAERIRSFERRLAAMRRVHARLFRRLSEEELAEFTRVDAEGRDN